MPWYDILYICYIKRIGYFGNISYGIIIYQQLLFGIYQQHLLGLFMSNGNFVQSTNKIQLILPISTRYNFQSTLHFVFS